MDTQDTLPRVLTFMLEASEEEDLELCALGCATRASRERGGGGISLGHNGNRPHARRIGGASGTRVQNPPEATFKRVAGASTMLATRDEGSDCSFDQTDTATSDTAAAADAAAAGGDQAALAGARPKELAGVFAERQGLKQLKAQAASCRQCRGCHEWWRSAAGGASGVLSIILALSIAAYALFIISTPIGSDRLVDKNEAAETYLKITVPVQVVVGSLCGLVILFSLWTIRKITCDRRRTLHALEKTTVRRRESKWLVIRVIELLQEKKGPNSPYVVKVLSVGQGCLFFREAAGQPLTHHTHTHNARTHSCTLFLHVLAQMFFSPLLREHCSRIFSRVTSRVIRYWACIVFAKELVETGLQIINVVGYANRGYSSISLYLYFAMIALNAVVWWMLTLPRTIQSVRTILMLNALISAFYGFFPLIYLVVDGMLIGRIGEIQNDSKMNYAGILISAAMEGLFGGTGEQVAAKVVFRLLPLFLSISAIEDLVGLDFYLKKGTLQGRSTANGGVIRGERDNNSRSASDHETPPLPTTTRATALSRRITRLTHKVSRSRDHRGLSRWLVVPAILVVLTFVFAMCGRITTLTQHCRYVQGTGAPKRQQQQHWVGRWCLYQAFPLLSVLPGSPSECACAVLFVGGDNPYAPKPHPDSDDRGPCDPDALTQLHDDLVNEDRSTATYLQILIHGCAMENSTQTGNILAGNLESVHTIFLNNNHAEGGRAWDDDDDDDDADGGGARVAHEDATIATNKADCETMIHHDWKCMPPAASVPTCECKFNQVAADMAEANRYNSTSGGANEGEQDEQDERDERGVEHEDDVGEQIQLRGLPPRLLMFVAENVSLANPSVRTFENCTELVELTAKSVGWTNIPSLGTNIALTKLDASDNRLSSWPRLLERLTGLQRLSMRANRLTSISAALGRLPSLKVVDVSNNTIASIDTLLAAIAAVDEATVLAQSGRTETLLLLGRNPVCVNETSGGAALLGGRGGGRWIASCQSQCSSMCPSVTWKPGGLLDKRSNQVCEQECNTPECSFDGGDCPRDSGGGGDGADGI